MYLFCIIIFSLTHECLFLSLFLIKSSKNPSEDLSTTVSGGRVLPVQSLTHTIISCIVFADLNLFLIFDARRNKGKRPAMCASVQPLFTVQNELCTCIHVNLVWFGEKVNSSAFYTHIHTLAYTGVYCTLYVHVHLHVSACHCRAGKSDEESLECFQDN